MISSMTADKVIRCPWASSDELYISYHDKEWGVLVHDDQRLFEFLSLEGAQAGLSWLTILKRREGYRKAFDNFNIAKVAKYDQAKIDTLINDEGIIRNRLKINSVVSNAKAVIKIQDEFGSLDNYFWQFVNGKPINHSFSELKDIPASNELAETISKDLKKRGLSFVGPTIIYAHMQATGMVNDHITSCFLYKK
jgi:DNA-3-methyladenine glycosylase I